MAVASPHWPSLGFLRRKRPVRINWISSASCGTSHPPAGKQSGHGRWLHLFLDRTDDFFGVWWHDLGQINPWEHAPKCCRKFHRDDDTWWPKNQPTPRFQGSEVSEYTPGPERLWRFSSFFLGPVSPCFAMFLRSEVTLSTVNFCGGHGQLASLSPWKVDVVGASPAGCDSCGRTLRWNTLGRWMPGAPALGADLEAADCSRQHGWGIPGIPVYHGIPTSRSMGTILQRCYSISNSCASCKTSAAMLQVLGP